MAAALLTVLSGAAYADSPPEISAQCAVVIGADGEVLYEKDADKHMLIASTTKLMTALVAAERLRPDEKVKIKPEYCGVEGSSMYLRAGETRTVYELLEGLLLVSGNDAATALACHAAGSTEKFAALMNGKAAELGLTETAFKNPHGLDEDGHYSTAHDLARLMLHCMDDDIVGGILGMKSAVIGAQTIVNHNRLLWRYKGCIGGKTGYTMAAGRCLVSCCEREGMRLVCVTLSAPDDWNDHMRLYDWAFSNYGILNITAGLCYEVPVVSGNRDSVKVVPDGEIRLILRNTERPVVLADLPRFVFAPVNSGETAGVLWVIIENISTASCRLKYCESVEPAIKVNSAG